MEIIFSRWNSSILDVSAKLKSNMFIKNTHQILMYEIMDVPLVVLSVVDLASPGVSRGGDGRGTVASNVVSDGAPRLDLSASVGRDLNRARPVAAKEIANRSAPRQVV
jgi:hypothetical protein